MSKKFYNGIDLMGQRAVGGADPTSGTDLATKQYVDNLTANVSWKDSVRVATTTNGALATAYTSGQTVDGVTLATGDRILLKNQTTGSENGIYVVQSSGAPVRASDADTAAELRGAIVTVEEGSTNGDKAFQLTTDNVTLGTTSLVFSPFAVGQTYTASNGVTLVGSDFRAVAGDATITVDSAGIKVASGAFVRKYAADLGALTAGTPLVVTHNLGTSDVQVTIREVTGGADVELDWAVTGVNTVTVTSGSAVSSGVLRVVVIG